MADVRMAPQEREAGIAVVGRGNKLVPGPQQWQSATKQAPVRAPSPQARTVAWPPGLCNLWGRGVNPGDHVDKAGLELTAVRVSNLQSATYFTDIAPGRQLAPSSGTPKGRPQTE